MPIYLSIYESYTYIKSILFYIKTVWKKTTHTCLRMYVYPHTHTYTESHTHKQTYTQVKNNNSF